MGESASSHSGPPSPKSYDIWGSAPGRVEFIGNHTDYNGGRVLGATINRRVDVRLVLRSDRRIRLKSDAYAASVTASLGAIEHQEGEAAWANYILGIVAVLQDEGFTMPTGFDLFVESALPVGAGLSSSAAVELATASALNEMIDGQLSRRQLARLSRRAENEFVGVPCGLLDQAVIACGDEDCLVSFDSRSETISLVPFPAHTRLWIFRTQQSHSLAEAHYRERHQEAQAARDRLDDLIGGIDHLVDVSPDQLRRVRGELPDVLFRRARHVSTEHRRVERTVQLLQEGDLQTVGDLLFASHESSRTDYENSTPELDFIVHRLADEEAVLGARLTGAGFGGAAMAWSRSDFTSNDAEAVCEAYAERFEESVDVLHCQPAPGSFSRTHTRAPL